MGNNSSNRQYTYHQYYNAIKKDKSFDFTKINFSLLDPYEVLEVSKTFTWNELKEAYKHTENVGVSQVLDGKATLHFLCPSQYNVGSSLFKRTLKKHVHYRMAYANGWLSDVQTLNVNC
jgi:hypothetical protein